jgi:LPS-assembly protein
LPRVQYSYFGLPDSLGGRTSVDFGAFNVVRTDGTNTRRMSLSTQWQRPFVGALGDLWKATLRNDAVGYDATHLNEQPTYGRLGRVDAGRSMPQAAVDFRWPFMRDAGAWGTQLIEPMAQVVVAPRAGDSQRMRYPNEDSLDFEFSDANLFGFNRFPGLDRMEGGVRANVALHGAWYLNGTAFDGIVGQSYKTARDPLFPAESGLRDKVSDVVARGSFSPAKWLDLTYRTRLDKNTLSARMIEATASVGARELRATGGYFYSATNSYGYYDVPAPPPAGSTYYRSRNELVAGVSSDLGPVRFQGFARRDFATNRMVAFGADIVYEDECFVLDLRVYRRNTSVNNDGGATTVLLLFTFKTIGDFGYRAF